MLHVISFRNASLLSFAEDEEPNEIEEKKEVGLKSTSFFRYGL